MHCIVCIVLNALFYMHYKVKAFQFMYCIICILFDALYYRHCIRYIIFYALFYMYYILDIVLYELSAMQLATTDWLTDGQTAQAIWFLNQLNWPPPQFHVNFNFMHHFLFVCIEYLFSEFN